MSTKKKFPEYDLNLFGHNCAAPAFDVIYLLCPFQMSSTSPTSRHSVADDDRVNTAAASTAASNMPSAAQDVGEARQESWAAGPGNGKSSSAPSITVNGVARSERADGPRKRRLEGVSHEGSDPAPPATPENSGSTTSSSSYPQSEGSKAVVIEAIRHGFKGYGEFVASQALEVLLGSSIILFIILAALNHYETFRLNTGCCQDDPPWWMMPLVVAISIFAICQQLYRFLKIQHIGSPVILYTSMFYFAATFLLYAAVIWAVGGPEVSVTASWFLIPLFNNPHQNAARMSQIALCSSHSRRIGENLANAMYVHAPTFFLDSIDKLLFFAGLWFAINENTAPICLIKIFSWYAVWSALVIFIVYFTFFPACLAIMIDLWMMRDNSPRWNASQILNTLSSEDGLQPVVHKIKVIVSTLLVIGHAIFAPLPLFHVESPTQEWAAVNGLSSFVGFCLNNYDRLIVFLASMAFSLYYLVTEDVDEARELRRTYLEELRNRNSLANGGEDRAEEEDSTAATVDTNSNSSSDEGIHSLGDASVEVLPSSSRNSDFSEMEAPPQRDEEVLASQEVQTELTMQQMLKDDESEEEEDSDSSGEEEDGEGVAVSKKSPRSLDDCKEILRVSGMKALRDEEVVMMLQHAFIKSHQLETGLDKNFRRAVRLRRKYVERQAGCDLSGLPNTGYEYHKVFGACCENVVGYVTLPVGWVGPLLLDGEQKHFPMATTEGCLVASVNRGCAVLKRGKGVTSVVTSDGMTRAPLVRFPNVTEMAKAKVWMENPDNFAEIKQHFDGESRFARLNELKLRPAGRDLFIRFVASTGDAMGMNMLSKGTQASITWLTNVFPEMEVISLSGNFCTDKKPAAVNWIDGRGKSVICEAVISKDLVGKVLKTTPEKLEEINNSKNLKGSALAGSIGGFNAQAANVVTAIFIATGQDPAQNVCSSNCLTEMSVTEEGDLHVTTTMPSIEVGTVGGGTFLTAQSACLDMMGVRGSNPTSPGANATQLARIVCAAVLAGELSLMSALTTGDLVRSHLRHNRSTLVMGKVKEAGASVPVGLGQVGGPCGAPLENGSASGGGGLCRQRFPAKSPPPSSS